MAHTGLCVLEMTIKAINTQISVPGVNGTDKEGLLSNGVAKLISGPPVAKHRIGILVKVLAKSLVLFVDSLNGEAKSCVIPVRIFQDNFHLLRYTLEEFERNSSNGETEVCLD